MYDLSLHILDLIENSIRAKATAIAVSVEADPDADELTILVEDNGAGLSVPASQASDPFYTTKQGKRTGLGLSLLRGAAERAGGKLSLGPSALGGLAVTATMGLSHIDRSPMGDLAATVSSVVCTNPEIDLMCRLQVGDRQYEVCARDVVQEVPAGAQQGLALARRVSEKIKTGLAALSLSG